MPARLDRHVLTAAILFRNIEMAVVNLNMKPVFRRCMVVLCKN